MLNIVLGQAMSNYAFDVLFYFIHCDLSADSAITGKIYTVFWKYLECFLAIELFDKKLIANI